MKDPVVRVLLYIATGILSFLLFVTIWFAFDDSGQAFHRRLDDVESAIKFNSCLLLFEPSERGAVVISDCQFDQGETNE